MQNPVVHFEMPTKDKKRVSEFYSKTFGWHMVQLDEKMGNYLMAHTTDTDEQGMVKTPGAINGGFFEYKDEPGYKEPHLVISVEVLDKSMEDVLANGGKIQGKPMDIPEVGKYVSFIDTEGNLVGMLEPPTRG